MDEERLIQGCRDNLASAQEALYNRYSARMLGVCYRYAKSREDAEDMLQEGFIKVFGEIGNFRQDGSLEGWIRSVIVHTCINHLKKNRKFNESVSLIYATNLPLSDYNIPSVLSAKQVIECIRLLPLGYRTVLNLYAIEGYSHKEIGEILEIKESTSRSQYTRAKNMLEDILIKKKVISRSMSMASNDG